MSRESQIQTLKEMGFSEVQAIGALNASKDDLTKAIAFLFGEVDDAVGAGTQQSPIHVEEALDYDSVAVSNPDDIPDFMSISHSQPVVEKIELVDPGVISASESDDLKREHDSNQSDTSDSDSESKSDEPFPPSEKTEDHQFPVILNKVPSLRTWVPVISILANFPPFVDALAQSKNEEPVVKGLQKILHHFTAFAEDSLWYVTTQELSEQLPDDFPTAEYGDDEALLNMLTCLISLEPALKPLLESMVESVEDDIQKELIVLEIEFESRLGSLYEALNELFWQKDYELFGQIKYSYVAPLVVYQLEPGGSMSAPFELPETFYPEIYSEKALALVKEELDSMGIAERNYQEVSRTLMGLNFFQGMKVDNLLLQAAKVVEKHSADASKDLEGLQARLSEQRAATIVKQKSHLLDASPQRLHLFERVVAKAPDLQPYSLLGVMLSDSQYFVKRQGVWVDMATREATDFAAVKRSVATASSVGPHLITVIYELQGGAQGGSVEKRSSERRASDARADIDDCA